MLEVHHELLATELNVKSVEPFASEQRRDLVLDYARLGRRLRAKVKAVAAAVASGDYHEKVDGSVEVAGERLALNEFAWRTRATSERGFAARDGLAVALDLAPGVALQREATARELARAVQELRKEARLRYSDLVRLAVVGESGELALVLDEYAGWLAEQCRVVGLTRSPLSDVVGTSTVELAGATVKLALGRAS
jgi:isoleucyl-tRNA synthetase